MSSRSLLHYFSKVSPAQVSRKPASKRAREDDEDKQEVFSSNSDTDSINSEHDDDREDPLPGRDADEAAALPGKQASRFVGEWTKGRQHWLRYVKGTGMFCTLCTKYDKRPFNRATWNKVPCTRLRLQSITAHEHSAAHRDSLKLEESARIEDVIVLPAVPAKGMEQAFSCLYFLVKQKVPHTTNYEPLLDFLEYLGVHVKSDIHVAKNATYTSDKSIQEMLYIISEILENDILKEMKDSDHLSLMFDETTDCTVTEQLAIHGRYIHKVTGELKSSYLKIIDILKPEIEALESSETEPDLDTCISIGASTITKRITEFITEAHLDTAKLRGVGTDGAATMIGHRNGVVARLKQIAPSIIGVHCAAHRLNLACVQAAEGVTYVKKFQNTLRQLYDFYDNSAVRTAGLQAIQTLVHEKGHLLAPCTTRWLSTERSVTRLKSCYVAVVLSLQREGEEKSDAKAIGLSRLVTEHRFVCTMLLLCDALPHVTRLSKCFQLSECDYTIIPAMLSSTIKSLEQLDIRGGVNLNGLDSYLKHVADAGIELVKKSNLGEHHFKESIKTPYLAKLISNLNRRFEDKSIMAAFDILNPAKLPPQDCTDDDNVSLFTDYGNHQVERISNQFGDSQCIADPQECVQEWTSFKQFLQDSYSHNKHCEVVDTLCSDTTLGTIYPNMSTIAKVCRVVPIHSADVERTFSQLKLIKIAIRNRMNEKTLDALLRISIEGPPLEEFPVSRAVQLWAKKKNRRLRV